MAAKEIFLIIMLLFLCAAAGAATFYVDNQNPQAGDSNPGAQSEPFMTIQKAADVAQAGDTVIVQPGNYHERISTKANGGPDNYITFSANGKVIADGFDIMHGYVTVSGFEMTGGSAGKWGKAVNIYPSANNINILGNYIHDLGPLIYGIYFARSGGRPEQAAQNVLIRGNTLKSLNYTMLHMYGANHTVEYIIFLTVPMAGMQHASLAPITP
ncbi:MAG TPA: DUF1565 domain-containing protein [Candidatus Diapherotrites archaeon]|uniref:DUF1565 domain-containing protein n=1 Tax=Candidatus Iainarchaeum sp. TaxID=3101447 RepID=A0A7J4IY78_9ARCH|nr:DUF1565 domain-containing protein [Candidatus Diapherotrites archaeon]